MASAQNRSRPPALPRHRPRQDQAEPAQVHLAGRADRAEGQGPGLHPDAADRHPALPLRRQAAGRRRAGRGRRRRPDRARASRNADGERQGRRQAGRARARGRPVARRARRRSSARSCELPRIEPKGKSRSSAQKDRYTGIRRVGPESLRHFKRTYREALRRQIATGTYNPENPIIVPIREDKRYRVWKTEPLPRRNAVIIYMMDVSGSMGDEQKEIVRIETSGSMPGCAASTRASRAATSSTTPSPRGRPRHVLPHARVGRHDDLQRLQAVREDHRGRLSRRREWNIYPFHFSDGDNWSIDDTVHVHRDPEDASSCRT